MKDFTQKYTETLAVTTSFTTLGTSYQIFIGGCLRAPDKNWYGKIYLPRLYIGSYIGD